MAKKSAGDAIQRGEEARRKLLLEKIDRGVISSREMAELRQLEGAGNPGFVPTMPRVAVELGVSERTVKLWIDKGAPGKTASGYDVEAIRAWRAEQGTPKGGRPRKYGKPANGKPVDPDDMDPDRRLKLAKARMAERELAILEGKLLPSDEVEQLQIRQILTVKQRLYQLTRTIPPKLHGVEPRTMEQILREEVDAICDEFAGVQTKKKRKGGGVKSGKDEDQEDLALQ